MARRRNARRLDVVLYGATGFVGAQTVAYFARHAQGLRWAIAGRSAAKLEAVRERCGARDAEVLVADAGDDAALAGLARDARIVLSTAGPFALHGDALVAACVAARTHYVDITGETPWVRRMIDRHHDRAAADGTRIVPCCGFDSVPSDLGAWLVARALWRAHREPCIELKAAFQMRGGVNGATLASALNAIESGDHERLAEPFLLNAEGDRPADAQPHRDPLGARHDADFGAWLAPFVMGPVNTRVVRRSAALLRADGDAAFGGGLRYQEFLYVGRGAAAALAASGVGIGMALSARLLEFAPVRAWARALAPPPGQGPSESAMDGGSFSCALIGRTASGRTLRGRIAGRGDPGNRATTIFVCESALALALEGARLPGGPQRGGVLTPATALGDALARRLADAGMEIDPPPG
jgi:short subunit dehydrogenase-like uncharacterized protein